MADEIPQRSFAGSPPVSNEAGRLPPGVDPHAETRAFVRRIFSLAEERVGGAALLADHLGLPRAELSPYHDEGVMPPIHVLLRTLDLVSAPRPTVPSTK